MSHEGDGLDHGAEQPLMDGLPNDLARRCLARASRQAHANMQMVCRSWAAFLQSAELLELRQEAGVSEEGLYMLAVADDAYRWGVLNPGSGAWQRLGPVPFLRPERILKHFQACPAGQGLLLVLGGSVWEPVSFLGVSSGAWVQKLAATREVWVFHPATATWQPGPPMLTARRGKFACALVGKKIIVAGGSDLAGRPLCDAEVLDLSQPGEIDGFRWEALPAMSLGRKDCLGAALGGCFWVVSGRRGGIENAFLNLHQSAEVLDVEDGTWSTVVGMWFSSEPPEHLAVFNGQIVASDSLGRQHRIKAYDEVSALWSDIGDGSRDGKPIVGLAAVEKQLYAVSWDALSRQLDEARSETESGGQTENGHEALPRFVYTVHCSSDCSAETNNSGAGALALVEGEMHALEVGNVGQDSPSSGLISVRDPCLLEQQGWWTRVAQFRSTVKLDLAICTGVSL